MKKLILVSALALTLSQTVGVIPHAFADTNTTATDTQTTVTGDQTSQNTTATDDQTATSDQTTNSGDQSTATDDQTTATDDQSATTADQSTADDSTKDESTSLLPDDFFYFVKTMIENLNLALSTNNTEQAKLLTQYTQERINEANALIKEGKMDLAAETLQKAIDEQKAAVDQTTTDGTNTTATTDSSTDTTATQDNTDTTATTDTTDNTQALSDVSQLPKPLQAVFTQNIQSLLNALSHVDNPKAQQALAKNIAKSFGKLAAKIDKHSKQLSKFVNATVNTEDQNTSSDDNEATQDDTNNTTVTSDAAQTTTTVSAVNPSDEKVTEDKNKDEDNEKADEDKSGDHEGNHDGDHSNHGNSGNQHGDKGNNHGEEHGGDHGGHGNGHGHH